ncbi:glycoside hydrolase family 88 protein [uncultured Sunxiuqinia sp.]|uniref:glycoside hydrolase family 88 protein n=1 Tax=uncultured Sunxiuqinia sp. TaxID=1573825 RepID=UPI002AA7D70E|nr:glycoside hydrolase family 88 protein [uncultured Sunxiuqinia sp.]
MEINIKGLFQKVLFVAFIGIFTLNASCTDKKKRDIEQVINDALNKSVSQSLLMAEKYADQPLVLPRSYIDGEMTTSDYGWWCSGFFPGVLWYLYEDRGDEDLLKYAKQYTARIEDAKYMTSNHDVGFMLYCSYGNGLRITGDTTYNEVLLTGAKSLSERYHENMGLIKSWDFNEKIWQYPVIIDNMMNLELLLWASKTSGDSTFKHISVSHADKTMSNHYRPDYSCYHVVSYDTITTEPHKKQTFQGYSDESSWSRGQAWGLYGFTYMYRETKEKRYLDQANRIASYLLNHPNMPKDYIPYWDFDAPNIPNEERDASAGALIASALIELSSYVEKDAADKYLTVAEKQIRTLASDEYTAKVGENGNFILMHSVGSKPHNSEVDVPLTYADYYYVEALVRYKKMMEKTAQDK